MSGHGPHRPEIPATPTLEAYRQVVHRADVWVGAAADVCDRQGLDSRGAGVMGAISSFPVVMTPAGQVVKFFGPMRNGMRAYDIELTALQMMSRDQDLPVPRLIAFGQLTEVWSYIVMSAITGVRIRDVYEDVRGDSLVRVGEWLGRFVSRLQAVALEDHERDDAWGRFVKSAGWRYERLGQLLEERGVLTPRLRGQLSSWMPSLDRLLGDAAGAVMLQGDINDNHVIGRFEDGHFRPAGMVDFNTFKIGDPAWELGLVWRAALRMDRPAFSAFRAATSYEPPAGLEFPRYALAWALLQEAATVKEIVDIESVVDLDELAGRAFGDEGPPLRPMARD